MKLLIDTNIVLDALLKREPWDEASAAILFAVAEDKAEGYITASTFTDMHYLIKKCLKNETQTRQILMDLLEVVSVLDVIGADIGKAFDLPMEDYEDALLAFCAKRHKMDAIITRNLKHYAGSPVQAIQPEKALNMLKFPMI